MAGGSGPRRRVLAGAAGLPGSPPRLPHAESRARPAGPAVTPARRSPPCPGYAMCSPPPLRRGAPRPRMSPAAASTVPPKEGRGSGDAARKALPPAALCWPRSPPRALSGGRGRAAPAPLPPALPRSRRARARARPVPARPPPGARRSDLAGRPRRRARHEGRARARRRPCPVRAPRPVPSAAPGAASTGSRPAEAGKLPVPGNGLGTVG